GTTLSGLGVLAACLVLAPEPTTTAIGLLGLAVLGLVATAVPTAVEVHNPPTRAQFTTRTERKRRQNYSGEWKTEPWSEWWVQYVTERYPCDCWDGVAVAYDDEPPCS